MQVIWLLAQGHTVGATSKVTAFGTRWVEQLLERYNASGPDALANGRRRNGLKPSLLTAEVLEVVRLRLAEPPPDGGLWTGRTVARWISGRIGRTVSPQRGVDYRRRLDLTRQVPRPATPKASLSEQARFKKSSRPASPNSKAPKRRFQSRSGRLTNTASG